MDCLHEKWMMLALDEARLGAESGEVPVGAVIVSNGEVIAKAHNLCETNHCATAHAELLAIEEASQKLSSWRLSNCTLYVTLEPCPMCTGAAINARIPKIVFAAKDPRAGACGSLVDLPTYPLESHPEIISGISQEESLNLLRNFFKKMRR
jgi:tRNA(adenine34) deaminase